MEAVECGAAALGIVLGYYRRFVSLEELRLTCGVSRDGVSAFQMIQAAKFYGLEGDGFHATWEELAKVDAPAILYWEENHFVVLEKIRGQTVWINDPATGPRQIHLDELRQKYSGIVILLKPSPVFEKKGKDISLGSRIKERFSCVVGDLSYLFVFEVIALILALSLPVFSRIFVDTFLQSSLPSWKAEFLWFIGFMMIATAGVAWLRGRFTNRLLVGLSIRFSTQFMRHILSLPISFFSQRYPGEVLDRIQLNTQLATVFTQGIVVSVLNIILVAVYGFIMFYYNRLIASVGLGSAVFNLLLLYWINRTRINAYARLQQEEAKTVGISYDTIDNIETMKSVSNDSFFFSRIAGHYTNSINALQSIGRKDVFLSSFTSFSVQLTNVLLLAVGAWLVMQGEFTIGMLIAFQLIMNNFLSPFGSLVEFGADLYSLKVDIARVDDVLQNKIDPLLEPKEKEVAPIKLEGKLEFRDITFGYAPLEEPYISDLSLSIQKGEMVGIVGPVGSGKTTLAKLGSALYQPWKGSILLDNRTSLEHSRETLKQSLASVDQEIKLFAATIYENIALWDNTITEKMVQEAAKRAHIHQEIARLPNGYHTKLLERGANLSQGQKQRLELARALIYEPSVLILDESLNSVDSETEGKILESLRGLGCTTLLISHRLSTVRGCDRIVVLEGGKIVGEGNHEELLRTSELYHKLCTFELSR